MIGLALAFALQVSVQPKPWMAYGPGVQSCGHWTQVRRDGGIDNATMQTWLAGFISGQNAVLSATNSITNILEGSDIPGANAWVDNYCAAHPLAPLSEAALKLSVVLFQRRAAR
ncbi:hypothetical protein NHF48_007550 [Sphingomonas sp. H160509]|uniref:hypothetical protein n=1 Tax=Sphingomonas sp. H160509 TaxID=2955313 RepID=UPI0020983545|nr:hypothetical protein [Sphingomonas sp. H160509]MDD1450855.1 hypothetical protein [Sphingomonas sp. H160509]